MPTKEASKQTCCATRRFVNQIHHIAAGLNLSALFKCKLNTSKNFEGNYDYKKFTEILFYNHLCQSFSSTQRTLCLLRPDQSTYNPTHIILCIVVQPGKACRIFQGFEHPGSVDLVPHRTQIRATFCKKKINYFFIEKN